MPTMGKPHGVRDGALVRRALMPKTQTHVYYAVDRSLRLVSVLAVWGARKRGEPAL